MFLDLLEGRLEREPPFIRKHRGVGKGIVPQDGLDALPVHLHIHLRPAHIRGEELPHVSVVIHAMPSKLHVRRKRVLVRDQVCQAVVLAADRPSRDTPGLIDRIRMQQQHPAFWIGFSQCLQVVRLVVNECEYMISTLLEMSEAGHFDLGHPVLPITLVHKKHIVVEMYSIRLSDLVERFQRSFAQRFWPPGHEADVCVGLKLEPTNHFEHTLERSLHIVDGFRAPALLKEPSQDLLPSPLG